MVWRPRGDRKQQKSLRMAVWGYVSRGELSLWRAPKDTGKPQGLSALALGDWFIILAKTCRVESYFRKDWGVPTEWHGGPRPGGDSGESVSQHDAGARKVQPRPALSDLTCLL